MELSYVYIDAFNRSGYLVAANQPVSQEKAARHKVTGLIMSVAPSAEGLGRVGSLRTDVATCMRLRMRLRLGKTWPEVLRLQRVLADRTARSSTMSTSSPTKTAAVTGARQRISARRRSGPGRQGLSRVPVIAVLCVGA
jgi:hypothetical protein